MTQSDDVRRENEALRQRTATLNGAILRINASLDLDTVESARALTGARYGAIATIDGAGAPQGFVLSGVTLPVVFVEKPETALHVPAGDAVKRAGEPVAQVQRRVPAMAPLGAAQP